MTLRPAIVLLALQLGAVPALAQRDGGFQRWPSREREAAPAPTPAPQGRSGARSRDSGSEAPPRRTTEPAGRPPVAETPSRQGGRGAGGNNVQRRQGRDDGRRVAVPRQGPPPPRVVQRPARPGGNIYVVRPPAYRYTPRFNRPYVYGSMGPGYFYYGSFGWYPRAAYLYDRGYFGRGYGFDSGEVRLRVEPRWAEVYVDGYYAGTVDDFDGTFQSLKLESGPYHIEIVAPGFETLEVDLRVTPGEKITYRGNLRREF